MKWNIQWEMSVLFTCGYWNSAGFQLRVPTVGVCSGEVTWSPRAATSGGVGVVWGVGWGGGGGRSLPARSTWSLEGGAVQLPYQQVWEEAEPQKGHHKIYKNFLKQRSHIMI